MKPHCHPKTSASRYVEASSREETQLMVKLDIRYRSFVGLDSFDHFAFIKVLLQYESTQIATTPALSPLTNKLFYH